IARAAQRAIRAGATLTSVLDVARRVRARVDAPLVLFTYVNPLLVAGEADAVRRAAAAGVDALLVVDLPPEESALVSAAAAEAGVALVRLVAPTSHAARVDVILAADVAGAAPSFVYYVSLTGVTGGAAPELARAAEAAAALRARAHRPVVVGFGVDGGAAARAAAGPKGAGADGVVVGTALVKRIDAATSPPGRVEAARGFVAELRAALDA
ncbi:MAG TPA: tryptophan synthase subunit alpha, partial [Byssovorax sp.]